MISTGDPSGHAWIEEQACSGLEVSPAQCRAALEAPDNVKLVHQFLTSGARLTFSAHARTAGRAVCLACTQCIHPGTFVHHD